MKGSTQQKLIAAAPGSFIALLHTFFAACAFGVALAVGVGLHYHKIVKNQWYSYPEEWFPSVSATIGDWAPERQLFQILIALTSGPRLLVVLGSYLVARGKGRRGAAAVALVGIVRTLACGGWVYVTSWEGGEVHDICMIGYIVTNIPWMWGTTALLSPASMPTSKPRSLRVLFSSLFFGTLVPLIYCYIQHKVHRVAGAYSYYALFEWSLIILDVAFDSVAYFELSLLEVNILVTAPDVVSKADTASRFFLAPSPLFDAEKIVLKSPPWIITQLWRATADWRHFLADIYLAFVFWTNLTGLGPMIFYQSVWSMGLSGDEVLLFCTLTPILLLSNRVQKFVAAHPVLIACVELVGILIYRIDDEGQGRLRTLGFALGIQTLGWSAKWRDAAKSEATSRKSSLIFGLGLLVSVLAKHSYHSLNPAWPFMSDPYRAHGSGSGGYNDVAVILGVLSVLDLASRHSIVEAAEPTSSKATPDTLTPIMKPSALSAYAFGALFFLIHFLYSDAGTIIAWAHTGYPLGPTAMPHGVLTILAISLGLIIPLTPLSSVFTSPAFFAVPLSSAYILYSTKRWTAFLSGLVLVTSSLSLLPPFMYSASLLGPGVFFRAFLTYNILVLASVWTVAYAFVPGGPLLRERTDIVLGVTMMLIGAGVWALNKQATKIATGGAVDPWRSKLRSFSKKVNRIIVLVLVGSVWVAYIRRRTEVPTPYHPEERLFTAAIWTMHFALDGRMWESQRRMEHIIREAELDVIGLLESDLQRIVMGNRDMTQYIADELGMYADIGPSPSSHTWGCALLSKFPILNSTHHLLPSPVGELAPAIHATLDVYGELVDIVVAHNGQEEDPMDRELQSQELARIMSSAWPRPVVFLGYVVTKPGDLRPSPYQILVEDGRVHDVDRGDHDRWCEYILFRGLHRVAYARLNRGSNPAITDTEIQAAKFVVPERDAIAAHEDDSPPSVRGAIPLKKRKAPISIDLTEAYRIPSAHVPEGYRFPSMFYGDGVRGHRFQVLTDQNGNNAPLYYAEPGEARYLAEEYTPDECKVQ
ncbi:hypothetical protein T439DRAFT_323432 [Meredithblackwellia eburnea MCA 4105]